MNNAIDWNIDPKKIIEITNNQIHKSLLTEKSILTINIRSNYKKFLGLLSDNLTEINILQSKCIFLKCITDDIKLKNACIGCNNALIRYITEFNNNPKIYRKIYEFKKIHKLKNLDLLFIDKLLNIYVQNGVTLTDENRKLFIQLNNNIYKIEKSIFADLNTDSYINIDKKYTSNFPESFKKPQGNEILFNFENFKLCIGYVYDNDIRKKIEIKYANKFTVLLHKIATLILLKHRLATMLGYNNYADLKTKSKVLMPNDSYEINNFLVSMMADINPILEKHLDMFNISKLESHNIDYFINKLKYTYNVNDEVIREYFELNSTVGKIMDLYQSLFTIQFVENNINSWHPNVKFYTIYKNNVIIGYLYIDLIKRNNVDKPINCFCTQSSCYYPYYSKKRVLPVCIITASFTGDKDILLNHSNVSDLFSKFSHVMHHCFCKTKYIIFSGVNMPIDLIEIPAASMNILSWNNNILKFISRHYKTNELLSDDVINHLIKIYRFEFCINLKKQIIISFYDRTLFSSNDFIDLFNNSINNNDYTMDNFFQQLFIKINEEISLMPRIEYYNSTGIPYEYFLKILTNNCIFYNSIWSQVIAFDIYYKKLHDKDIGNELIKFYKYGSCKGTNELITEFLKSEHSSHNFFKFFDIVPPTILSDSCNQFTEIEI